MPKFDFTHEAPSRIRVYPCPACHETISVDATSCRFCHVPIDFQTAQRLLAENQRVTTIVAHANTFSISANVAVIVAIVALYELLVEGALYLSFFIVSAVAIGFGIQWLYRSRSLVTHDPDLAAAVKKVKRTILIWVAVDLFQLGAYAIVKQLS